MTIQPPSQMDVPASTCPLCNQMIPTNEEGELAIHFFNGEKCPRSETFLSRVEDSFAEHALSEKASEALLNAMKNNSARPKIPIKRLPRKDKITDRRKGSLYGLAIGDALGAAVEFRRPRTFPPVVGYRDGGPHGLLAGQWTDDTSMALALADSIGQKEWNTKDQLQRYLNWFEKGEYSVNGFCFDIGNTTREALNEFEISGTLEAESDESLSGNGSIMRLTPVVIKYYNHPSVNLAEYLAESSKTTHASVQCVDACIALGLILKNLMLGCSKEEALDKFVFDSVSLCDLVKNVVINYSYRENKTFKGSGWVIESLEAALWSFYTSNSFEECVLKAVNLGDDADTTGAVAGQLAGAYWGFDNIPQNLIDGLDRKDMIDKYLNLILE